MKLNKKKKGFTLIELMAVIAIVAILAAVLVPTVSGYIDRSKKTALITQIRSVVNAVEVYDSTASVSVGDVSIKNLLPGGNQTAFINQDLLKVDDVTKLNESLTVEQLKTINSDENAVNNIYKSKATGELNGKFVYSFTSGTPAVAGEVKIEK